MPASSGTTTAAPSPAPRLRKRASSISTRDGVQAEIVYGCLMINEMLADTTMRGLGRYGLQRLGCGLCEEGPTPTACSRSRSCRTAIPNRRRQRCGAAPSWVCAAAILRSSAWASRYGTTMVRAVGSRSRMPLPDLLPLHRLQGGCARLTHRRWRRNTPIQYRLVRSALFQTDTMEVLVSLLASGACEKYPDFNFVLGDPVLPGCRISLTGSTPSIMTAPAAWASS